ncbi:hypothetical protein QR98_0057650 [Sarcoptes scabiei]|uniref:Retrovirus-related Pol polyprotein from transposon TNT 1-94-like beta-barrel domain-containing protein n=1 Tax=Sarcoptes scabiei TaxID=52283 RepID=A0A132A8G3_SARSC|nr:hypothetical protein QR98_0057650 [Sarcoptes scabiei]
MKFQCKKKKSKRDSKEEKNTEETARKYVTLCSIFNSKNLVSLVNQNKFIADDGAFFHVLNDSSLVENLKPTREVLATMNGEITATSKGDLVCKIYNGSEWKSCRILDVLVVENQPFNVISIGKICQRENVYATTNKNGIKMFDNGEPVLVGS